MGGFRRLTPRDTVCGLKNYLREGGLWTKSATGTNIIASFSLCNPAGTLLSRQSNVDKNIYNAKIAAAR